jgi:hypothetical protein
MAIAQQMLARRQSISFAISAIYLNQLDWERAILSARSERQVIGDQLITPTARSWPGAARCQNAVGELVLSTVIVNRWITLGWSGLVASAGFAAEPANASHDHCSAFFPICALQYCARCLSIGIPNSPLS